MCKFCVPLLLAALVCAAQPASATATATVEVTNLRYVLIDLDWKDGIAAELIPGQPTSDSFAAQACAARLIQNPCRTDAGQFGASVQYESVAAFASGFNSPNLRGTTISAGVSVLGEGLHFDSLSEQIAPARGGAAARVIPGDAVPFMLTPNTLMFILVDVSMSVSITNDAYHTSAFGQDHLVSEHAAAELSLGLGQTFESFALSIDGDAGSKSLTRTVFGGAINTSDENRSLLFNFYARVSADSPFDAPTSSVPEPSTAVMLALGLLGLRGRSWRRASRMDGATG